MTDTQKLIERLRALMDWDSPGWNVILRKSADALEAQQQRIAELEARAEKAEAEVAISINALRIAHELNVGCEVERDKARASEFKLEAERGVLHAVLEALRNDVELITERIEAALPEPP